MTVTSPSQDITHATDGSTVTFPIPFYFISEKDIVVDRIDANEGVSQLVLGTDFTVSGAGDQNGGTLTTLSVQAAGFDLHIYRNIAVTQETQFQQNDPFPAKTNEKAFDKLTMICQQIASRQFNSIRYPLAEYSRDGTLPGAPDRAGKILGFDANGAHTMLPIPASVGAGDMKNEAWTDGVDFVAGTDNSVLLSRAYGNKANLGTVVMQGIPQDPASYSIGLGNRLTFDAVIPVGVSRIWCNGGTTVSLNVPAQGSVGENELADMSITDEKVKPGTRLYFRLNDWIDARDYGAMGSDDPNQLNNDTMGLQAALDAAHAKRKAVWMPSRYYGVSDTLTNRGVSMLGQGTFYSQITPLTSFPAGKSFIVVKPDPGGYIDFLELGRFSINPTNGSTRYGGVAIFMDFSRETNLARLHMHDLYLMPGNDYSLRIENNLAVNLQGVPSNSVIERCAFWEGTKLIGIGDSNTVQQNIFRASGNRTAMWVYMADVSGIASHFVARENNIDCPGGALYAIKGRNIKLLYNNIEHSAGAGTPNGAVVDFDGSSGALAFPAAIGNHIGIFGTSTAIEAIRVNGARGCAVDQNTMLASAPSAAQAILLTPSAQDTDVGLNEIGSGFTVPYTDGNSVRPIGIPVALTLVNGFGPSGDYQPPMFQKGRNGIVSLNGVVSCPAAPNGVVIGTLPVGYRPVAHQRFSIAALIGGGIAAAAIEIGTTGDVVYFGGAATRADIGVVFMTPPYISGEL
ncbi:hypothetical protein KDW82_03355 [Burkholderia vietnamiensis]|uniref:hypothetical protein n=1 Tax=Burkholderia vietnamiensis TaxID=60552 RepID=UPI001B9CF546|nr:hypothetical protein [Burkholderia vietnamiensis]MBR8188101.1 hypothetical protein [Burkholderia vietnamiensis]